MGKQNQNKEQAAAFKTSGVLKALLQKPELGTVLPMAILMLAVAIVNISFFNLTNILDILRTASFSFIVAVPITFLMSSGGMDLSIGATTSFGGIICAFALKAGICVPAAVLLALAAGCIVGFLNGIIIVKYSLPAFIATLGMQYVVNGIIAITTEALAISGFGGGFKALSQTKVAGVIPMPIIYAILIGIVGHIVLSRTKFGRSVLAIGGNRETAYLAGINVQAKQIMVYAAVGLFSALSGVLIASRFATAQPAAGTGTELTIMASVIIGGTSMFGGQGTIIGSALGCVLFATIQNALIVMGISTFWQNLIFGIILLVAIFIDKYRRKTGGEE
ncbi:MAG: ABC transporter permease [Hungatella sp.]|nr:ABC transporter permease [Hungatella sp.]